MLRKKSFVKKTRKGNIVQIQREHYLRDDIGCGSLLCDACLFPHSLRKLDGEVVVGDDGEDMDDYEDSGRVESGEGSIPTYLVVDTNIVLHQVR